MGFEVQEVLQGVVGQGSRDVSGGRRVEEAEVTRELDGAAADVCGSTSYLGELA